MDGCTRTLQHTLIRIHTHAPLNTGLHGPPRARLVHRDGGRGSAGHGGLHPMDQRRAALPARPPRRHAAVRALCLFACMFVLYARVCAFFRLFHPTPPPDPPQTPTRHYTPYQPINKAFCRPVLRACSGRWASWCGVTRVCTCSRTSQRAPIRSVWVGGWELVCGSCHLYT